MNRRFVVLALLPMAVGAQTPASFETSVRGQRRIAPALSDLGPRKVAESGAQNAVDVMEWDVALSSSSGARGERIFTLRGFDQRQVAVLLDGAPFELPYDGQVDLAMVPAALLERVELMKSPGSVSVGPNGLGGAVNLVTRRPGGGPFAKLFTELGPSWGHDVRFEHSSQAKDVGWTFGVGHQAFTAWPLPAAFSPTFFESGPARTNSDKQLDHVALSMTALLKERHQLTASVWGFDGARGMPPSTIDDRPRYWRFSVWRALNAQLAHRYETPAVTVDTMGWVRRFDNLVDSFDNGEYRTQTTPRAFASWYRDPTAGARSRVEARWRVPWGPLVGRVWAGGQWQAHDSTTTQGNVAEHRERLTATLAPELETSPARWLTAQAALQADAEVPLASDAKPASALGPRLTLQVRPAMGLVFTASGARTTRFPSLRERFSEGLGFREPNPLLGPEAAWTATAEARWAPNESLELLLFASHSEVQGLINTVTLPTGLTQLQNLDHAQLTSVEGKVSARPHHALRLEAGVQGLRAVQLTGSGPVPLEYRAPVQAVGELRWTPATWLLLWAGVKATSARPFFNPDTRTTDALPAFAELSARVELRPSRVVSVWFRGTNLTDSLVDGQYGFPRPGRQLFAGLSLEASPPGDTP